MSLAAALLFSCTSLTGYIVSGHYLLKVPLRLSPLFSLAIVMNVLFWAALADMLRPAAMFVLCFGILLFLCMLTLMVIGRKVIEEKNRAESLYLLAFLVALAFICALPGKPSVIDDYSYWAIIAQSIAHFDALPAADTSIFARHLTYTPGLALLQYYFFGLASYNLTVSYLSQNILLVFLLFALADGQKKAAVLGILSCSVIVLILFSGSVFQKLRADHFLYLTSAVIVWNYMKGSLTAGRFLVLAAAITTLYLIKEVGLFLAIFLLIVIFLDLFAALRQRTAEIRSHILFCLMALIYVACLKLAWDKHCTAQAFDQFHSGITFESVKSAFHLIANSESRQGFLLFLKAIFFGAADRLNLPYVAWYCFLALLWRTILKSFPAWQRRRHAILIISSLCFFLLYLAMNYVMQVVIFGLGSTVQEPVSLDRYINIFLCWFILFTLCRYLSIRLAEGQVRLSRLPLVLSSIAGLLLIVSSIPERQTAHEQEIEQLLSRLESTLTGDSRVCISPGEITDHYLGFRLLYFLFPNRFNVVGFPGKAGPKRLEQKLSACDYVLVYLPDGHTVQLFSPYTSAVIEHMGLYQVLPRQSQANRLSLQRIY